MFLFLAGRQTRLLKIMRIHIFNNGLMVENGMSGSDRRALEWSKIFTAKGISVMLYTSSFGQKRYRERQDIACLTVTEEPTFLKHPFLAYLYRGLKTASHIEVKDDDVFYSSSDLLADSLPAILCRLRNQQTSWMTGLHLLAPNPLKSLSAKSWYYFWSQKLMLFFARRRAKLVLVSNNLDRETLLRQGFSADQVLVTFGAVNWLEINQAKTGRRRYEAVFIGRYHPQKGLEDLLLIWQIVCQKLKRAKLALIGELEPLQSKIKDLGLGKNVESLGVVDGVEKFSLLKSSQVFLFPSHHESFGLVAAEAMAVGLPVVAYDLPVYRDIYPQGMVKIPIGSCQIFAQEVIRLLSNEVSRKKLGKQAKEVAKAFSWEKTGEEIWQRINKL